MWCDTLNTLLRLQLYAELLRPRVKLIPTLTPLYVIRPKILQSFAAELCKILGRIVAQQYKPFSNRAYCEVDV